jgi:CheY-like chemotaxis protein
MQILILDDNPEIMDLMTAMLYSVFGRENCQIVTGQNGQEGLTLLEQITPDLILTNLRMPHMDGMTFLHEVRRQKHWDHIHLVMVSALATPEILIQARRNGAEAFIRKPFTMRDLKTVLTPMLEI